MSEKNMTDEKMNHAVEPGHSAPCYTAQAWLAFQAGAPEEAPRILMERHLLECDSCLHVYLTLAENSISHMGAPDLNDGFTDRVMAAIKGSGAGYKKKADSKLNLLIGYCAAACIAMFFWTGGFFDEIAGGLAKGVEILDAPTITAKQYQPPKINLIQAGWTKKNIEKQPFLFDNFKSKKE
jgi:hypothetical protein